MGSRHTAEAPPLEVRVMIGRTRSHYEITRQLGAGGMGEVYLARDTKLARNVALKVLPADLADDPARLRRLED